MFPLLPKVPNIDGKLKQTLKRRFDELNTSNQLDRYKHLTNFDHVTYQLAEGGPVARALRKDICSFQIQFQNSLQEKAQVRFRKGCIFQLFKNVYHETRFALLHFKSPRRSDKEAFIQLTYSTVLEYLHEAPHSIQEDYIKHMTFVIFLLYTLHQTNPFNDPPTGETKEEQISLLPFGATNGFRGRFYRRYYRSNIRISLQEYQKLVECKTYMMGVLHSDSKNGKAFIQTCMALDCILVMDRLENLFEFCECSGPASLEGFIGSIPHFHKYALLEKSTEVASNSTSLDVVLQEQAVQPSESLEDLIGMNQFAMEFQRDWSTYKNLSSKLFTDIAMNQTSSRPSKQLKSVEQALTTLSTRNRPGSMGNVDFIGRVSSCLNGGELIHLPILDCSDQVEQGPDVEIILEPTFNEDESIQEEPMKITLPFGVNSGMQKGIASALKGFTNLAVARLRSQTQREKAKTFVQETGDWYFNDCFDEFDAEYGVIEVESIDNGEDEMNGMAALNHLLHQASGRQNVKHLPSQIEDSDDGSLDNNEYFQDDESISDGISLNPNGQGAQALAALLNASRNSKKNSIEKRNIRKKRKKRHDDDESIHTMATIDAAKKSGAGQLALSALIQEATDGNNTKRKRLAKDRKSQSPKGGKNQKQKQRPNTNDDQSVHTMATLDAAKVAGIGQLALSALIQEATKSETPKRKRSTKPRKEKAIPSRSTEDGINQIQKQRPNTNDDESIHTMATIDAAKRSGTGQLALSSLIQQVKSSQDKKHLSTEKEKKKGAKTKAKEIEHDEMSVQTMSTLEAVNRSGSGQNALNALLEKVDGNKKSP
ncbi:hypothetical protein CTEN210_02725 [Chaetoceros tenuissimus]|uniref:Uncharacterized protein n=1 Tax=Chaetoceros tenuissimus TaxID=426638 RepID=A0AAD3CJY3_9STRA|nr:hypothetical protein CTEN210_02725 [Chaetoceros tenuissimus]